MKIKNKEGEPYFEVTEEFLRQIPINGCDIILMLLKAIKAHDIQKKPN